LAIACFFFSLLNDTSNLVSGYVASRNMPIWCMGAKILKKYGDKRAKLAVAASNVEVPEVAGATQLGSAPKPFAPGLYIAATPIGNLGDITLRVLETLKAADVILCEDTRVTAKLLNHYGIDTPKFAYHDHNADRVLPQIIERLERREIVVQVTDAGTPLISDPGYRLVQAAREKGILVTALPGPSAVVTALSIAGLPVDRFLFLGFLPPKSAARRRMLGGYASVDATLVVYESPRRVAESIADMAVVLGARPAAVCRELTKMFEEVKRGSLTELAEFYAKAEAPRGEVVIVVGPPADVVADAEKVRQMLVEALADMSVREAADAVAEATGWPRRDIYRMALELAGRS
jgi:16S rRNA (cytidine1402-2'-O)-methyltransferase